MALKNEAESRKRRLSNATDDSEEVEQAFHFIAFVPALGKVWKFDGLERQPHNLGECAPGDWLKLARPVLLTRMADCEQFGFSILGLVRDPLGDLMEDLAGNVKTLQVVQERVHQLRLPNVLSRLSNIIRNNGMLIGPDETLGLTQESVVKAREERGIPKVKRQGSTSVAGELLERAEVLSHAQRALRTRITEEQTSQRNDSKYAEQRRFDYGPALRTWLEALKRKQVIGDLAERKDLAE